MIKKFLSVLLAVMMVVSVMAVGVVTSNAATTDGFTPESTKFYFDVEGTGWDMSTTKDKIAFYMAGGDFDTEANPTEPIAWGGKKLVGTATSGQTGIFEFDPAAKVGYKFTPGVQYKIIFAHVNGANWKEQTCSLFFTTDCFGHVAYSDGTEMENDVDSTKKSKTVYWRGIDPEENGPVLAITSIGNVVGSCVEQGKTKYSLFVEFLSEAKTDFQDKTCYENAHKYKCEIDPSSAGYKSEQKLIDDIGAGLGLTKDDIKAAFEEDVVKSYFETAGISCAWSYDDSTLPAGSSAHTHTPGEPVQENVVPASCKAEGSYDEVVYCTECGEEISREQKTIDKLAHTPGEAVQENVVVTHDKTTYDEVVYCTECQAEISRTPVELPIVTHTLTFVPEVPATEQAAGTKAHYTCSGCDKLFSDAAGTVEVTEADLVIPKLVHIHTPGEPVQENVVPASCTVDGSYDEVVYCTACQEEISRETKTIKAPGHELSLVAEVPATATKDGVKSHYACANCEKLFADAEGTQEVTPESLVILAEFVRGDVNKDGIFDSTDVTVLQRVLVEYEVPSYNAVAADVDLDGEVDAIDVTLMQRVLANMTTWDAWDAKHPA
ncbi:MAG: dockerin type I repeat-containing protein [Ruminococcus sp.]|nr:dockerin type I repeat-containing protein [Ruminococcus sp.]MBQ1898525.1 dockerin type I repeat-containing protein [Ruminococcus sp.]